MRKNRHRSGDQTTDTICLTAHFGLQNDRDRFIAHCAIDTITLTKIATREFAPSKKQQQQILDATAYMGWTFLL